MHNLEDGVTCPFEQNKSAFTSHAEKGKKPVNDLTNNFIDCLLNSE